VVSGETIPQAEAAGLGAQEHLDNNDSYGFFRALAPVAAEHPTAGGLIRTGPTGTNVNDLLLLLAYER
jgi:glycerate-2-kinase